MVLAELDYYMNNFDILCFLLLLLLLLLLFCQGVRVKPSKKSPSKLEVLNFC